PSRPSPARVAIVFAKPSRYCRHEEYEEYAEVSIDRNRVRPSCAWVRTSSVRYGAQLRLPQISGVSIPRRSSSPRKIGRASCRERVEIWVDERAVRQRKGRIEQQNK